MAIRDGNYIAHVRTKYPISDEYIDIHCHTPGDAQRQLLTALDRYYPGKWKKTPGGQYVHVDSLAGDPVIGRLFSVGSVKIKEEIADCEDDLIMAQAKVITIRKRLTELQSLLLEQLDREA